MEFLRSWMLDIPADEILAFETSGRQVNWGKIAVSWQNDKMVSVDNISFEHYRLLVVHDLEITSNYYWRKNICEILRRARSGAIMSLLVRENEFLSIFALKRMVAANREVVLLRETRHLGDAILVMFRVCDAPRVAQVSAISFGICTNGVDKEKLYSCINAISRCARKASIEFEILLTCHLPEDASSHVSDTNIRIVPVSDTADRLNLIGIKKNMLVQHSRYETIVVMHDRIYLVEDFVAILNRNVFFDILVPRTALKNGTRLADWVGAFNEVNWTSPFYMDYSDYAHLYYINGPIVVGRASILRACPWNSLIAWNQAEDIDFSITLRSNGVVPVLSDEVMAISGPVRDGMIALQDVKLKGRDELAPPVPFGGWIELSDHRIQSETIEIDGKISKNIRFKVSNSRTFVSGEIQLELRNSEFVEQETLGEVYLDGERVSVAIEGGIVTIPYSKEARSITLTVSDLLAASIWGIRFLPTSAPADLGLENGRFTPYTANCLKRDSLVGWDISTPAGAISSTSDPRIVFYAPGNRRYWKVCLYLRALGTGRNTYLLIFSHGRFVKKCRIAPGKQTKLCMRVRIPKGTFPISDEIKLVLAHSFRGAYTLSSAAEETKLSLDGIRVKRGVSWAHKVHYLLRKVRLA